MAEQKVFPPNFVKPGQTTRAEWPNGIVEFVGVYDDKVIEFVAAAYELLRAIDGPKRPSAAQMGFLERKAATAFNNVPNHLKKLVKEKLSPGEIWIPDGKEGDNAV